MFTPGRILALFAAGGVGLALCDQIHVQARGARLRDGRLFREAWWVPLQFGVAALAIVAGAAPFARGRAKPGAAAFLTGTLWFVAAYAASGLFDAHPYALAAAFVVTWALRVALARQPSSLVTFSLLLAAAGTGAEAILSAAGTFAYANPDLLGVPIWLPASTCTARRSRSRWRPLSVSRTARARHRPAHPRRRRPRPPPSLRRADSGGMRHERHYTLEEATATRPGSRALETLRAARERLTDSEVRDALAEAAPTTAAGGLGRQVSRRSSGPRAAGRCARREIVLRDLDRGLVDFPALREGREVYLCWVDGERTTSDSGTTSTRATRGGEPLDSA